MQKGVCEKESVLCSVSATRYVGWEEMFNVFT